MWTPQQVQTLRLRLGMEVPDFARIVGVDPKTVHRWEAGDAKPSGAAEAVLSAIREKLAKDPGQADDIVSFLLAAAAVGGLTYLLLKLLDSITEEVNS